MTLTSPGLPDLLPGENISCHLADSQERFPPVIVPAVEVTPGTVFSCDIQGLVPDYPGVTAIINLGFQSSLFNVPFDITNQALTIYRCSAGERYHPHSFSFSVYNICHTIIIAITNKCFNVCIIASSEYTIKIIICIAIKVCYKG